MSRRLALVVANDSYRDQGLPPLYAPRHDAQQLRELLRDPEIGAFDPADILVNESKAEIERAIERLFLDARPGDLVLLYFSGHGVRARSGRLHLAVGNTELGMLASTAVSASFVKELVDESDASSTVVLLDCCYSGAFAGDGLKSDPEIDVGRELQAGRGTYVLTASSSVQTADDGQPGALSLFTEAVVRGLSTGAADVRGVGRITPNDLWEYVRQEVPSRTTRQTPTQYGYVEDEVHLASVRRAFPSAAGTGGLRVHLGDLLGPLTQTAEHGLRAETWQGTGRLVVPVGQVFRGTEPAEPVWLDLARVDGHVLVVGRIGSGKSTFLRTLIGALALTHDPDQVRFYCLESGGNKLGSLRRLPSFARLAGDDEPAAVDALLAELAAVVDQRKQLFRQYEIDSPTRFRAVRDTLPGGPHPDAFLVVDRLSEFAGYAGQIRALAGAGLDYGVHLVVAARGWRDVPDELEELINCRIELSLGRASESHVDTRLAEQLAADRPGWALLRRTRFLIALPELRSAIGTQPEQWSADPSDGALDLVDRVAKAWSRLQVGQIPEFPPALQLPPQVPGKPPPQRPLTTSPDILELLGVDPTGLAPAPVSQQGLLRVPIGVDPVGSPVELDLKDSPSGGVGPHGLLVGATGSGKSELLRTLVTGLALRHQPEQLNFLFADYKGGAVYRMFDRLPHTAGVVTNLAEDLTLVDRLAATVSGELARRQDLLRAGSHQSIWDYQRALADGDALHPLPHLLFVCDEFTDLLVANPDFIDLFLQIGRTGRSLGIHLLLASQRLDEGRLRGLDTYLSYRIALRTFSASESRAAIGVPDAYELPHSPGHGYLKTGGESAVRFLAATSFQQLPAGPEGESVSAAEGVIQVLSGRYPATRRIWLPPLDRHPDLDALLGPVEPDPQRGLTTVDRRMHRGLRVPLGLVDKPFEQRQEPLWLSIADATGTHASTPSNVAIVGGRRSGKTSLLQALATGLALTHTPAEVQMYVLDFGQGALDCLSRVPHVGGVAGRSEPEVVRRTIGELTWLLAERERLFPGPSFATLGEHDAATETDPRKMAAVVLLVDGWAALRTDFDDLNEAVSALVTRGPRHGIHVVATVWRWAEFKLAIRDWFGYRLELRLADPAESELSPRQAAKLPADRPGHGITADGDRFIAAAPTLSTLDGGVSGTCDAVARSWSGPPAPPVRLLPTVLRYEELDLRADPADSLALPIGIAETDLRQVSADFAADPHFLLFGDVESGKSTFLRTLATTITRRFSPQQARLILVDYRRSLLGTVSGDHLIGYGTSASTSADIVEQLVKAIQSRLPAPDVTLDQLRDRSWWRGPECVVLVDDYELVAAGPTNPLLPLVEYLPQARDIGLHLVVARRSGGAGRALLDPVIQTLRELSSPGLVLSGSKDEGPLLGTVRPEPLPPGRAWLVTRHDAPRLIQLPHLPDPRVDQGDLSDISGRRP